MKIARIRIQNFRSFKDETISLNNYNCLVGANGSGKSNVLAALNIFFRDTFHSSVNHTILYEDDFYCRNVTEPIRITVTFVDLNAEAQDVFTHYYRGGELSITAEAKFDPQRKIAEVIQYGERKGILAFAPCFAATSATDAKTHYGALQTTFTDLPSCKTHDAIRQALSEYEGNHDELCELIPSSDQFYGFTSGTKKLEQFVLWVYVPAVKDLKTEEIETRNTALGKLLALTVRASVNFDSQLAEIKSEAATRYERLLQSNQASLDTLSVSLQTKLQEWAHPSARLKLQWKNDAEDALKIGNPIAESIAGEGVFDGHITRFGHGLQRSYLLALLQELSSLNTQSSPTLILGCEEPELYQHPPQAKHLVSVLLKLSEVNSQIIVSTHTPYFVSGKNFEDVRYVKCNRTNNSSTVHQIAPEKLLEKVHKARGEPVIAKEGAIAKIHQALQPNISEMFFAPFPIFLEGQEDVAYLTTYMHLMNLWDKFREYGCHFVPVNNKNNLFNPIAIAKEFGIPFFVIFDSDSNITNVGERNKHSKDNLTILNLCDIQPSIDFPADDLWATNLIMWTSNIGDVIQADFNSTEYERVKNETNASFSNAGNLHKNSLFIAELLTNLWESGNKSQKLEKICNEIIHTAGSYTNAIIADQAIAVPSSV